MRRHVRPFPSVPDARGLYLKRSAGRQVPSPPGVFARGPTTQPVAEIEQARARERRINDQLKMKIKETPSAPGFTTWDDTGDLFIHQSYISKESPQPEQGK